MVDYCLDIFFSVDMDEFIVPAIDLDGQTTQDLVNMIGRFKKPPTNKRSDSFLFKNSFFCGEYNNDKVSDPHSDENFDIFRYILIQNKVINIHRDLFQVTFE